MFYSFVQDKIWKLVTYNTPSTTKRRNVIDSEKQSGLFWPTLYNPPNRKIRLIFG